MATTVQKFKENDTQEDNVSAALLPLLESIGADLSDFYDDAFITSGLGDVLYALDRDSLVGVVDSTVYRNSFWAIHNLFTRPGTFEFYLTLFRAIWGDDVEVFFNTYDIDGYRGWLLITVSGETVPEYSNLKARRIVSGDYIYDQLVTQGGDNLVAAGFQGIQTQDNVNRFMAEIAVQGIFTTCQLSF